MLSIEQLPIDIKGITPQMREELEQRIEEFEQEYEPSASQGGAGYVPKVKKGDFVFAGIINGAILLYYVIAVLMA